MITPVNDCRLGDCPDDDCGPLTGCAKRVTGGAQVAAGSDR